MEMEGGVMASFTGNLATKGVETTWNGDWRIEGTAGMLTIQEDQISLFQGERAVLMDTAQDMQGAWLSGRFSNRPTREERARDQRAGLSEDSGFGALRASGV